MPDAVRVVLDTNILVSCFLTQGKTISKIIGYWESGEIEVLASPPLIEELREVLGRPRIRKYLAAGSQILLDAMIEQTVPVAGELTVSEVCRDPKDDKFLASAAEGSAQYIVTGDSDLLDLGAFRSVRIIKPFELVELLENAGSGDG